MKFISSLHRGTLGLYMRVGNCSKAVKTVKLICHMMVQNALTVIVQYDCDENDDHLAVQSLQSGLSNVPV